MNKFLVLLFLSFVSPLTLALDVEPADVESTVFTLSSNELNRISVQGDKIVGIKHTIPVEATNESTTGDIYIKLLSANNGSIFVTTEKGAVYKINVTPKSTSAKNINILSSSIKPVSIDTVGDPLSLKVQKIIEFAVNDIKASNRYLRNYKSSLSGVRAKVVYEKEIDGLLVNVLELTLRKGSDIFSEQSFSENGVVAVYIDQRNVYIVRNA